MVLLIVSGLILAFGAFAQEKGQDGKGKGHGRKGPRPESFAACEDKAVGDACSFESPRGDLEGVCATGRSEKLHCRPNDMKGHGKGHGRKGPPAESFAACEDKAAGDACSFESPRGELEGICATGRSDTLHCRPNDRKDCGKGHGRKGPPPESFSACEAKAEGDACTVETPRGELEGVCTTGRIEKLHCRPNDMKGPGKGGNR
jgi:hypothetical protein